MTRRIHKTHMACAQDSRAVLDAHDEIMAALRAGDEIAARRLALKLVAARESLEAVNAILAESER